MRLYEDSKFVYSYLRHCDYVRTSSIELYTYIVNPGSSVLKYYGNQVWHDLTMFRDTALKTINEFKCEESVKEQCIEDINCSHAHSALHAIYSIYRSKNSPKDKYANYKTFKTISEEIIPDVTKYYTQGVSKIYALTTKVSPFLSHIFLSNIFRVDRLRKKIQNFFERGSYWRHKFDSSLFGKSQNNINNTNGVEEK